MNNDKLFSINAKTSTLKYNNQEDKSIILYDNAKYIIPIYQRPYSWTDEQLRTFIIDIFYSFWGNDGNSPSEPMFIGTMQLSHRNKNNEQDIIDGQQRLTTFLLLIKVLQNKFPECNELNKISLDWLFTRVNNGKQQSYLEEAISSELPFSSETQNPYLKNAFFINELIDEQTKNVEEDQPYFSINKFIQYLLSSVYFVIIETRAGLSKTLQIFNAINTTGLELNGGDIFKIRMYEYLKDKRGMDETAFEEISRLYQKVDEYNASLKYNATDIRGILAIYQYIIIAKYNLPVVLYNYGVDRFFEQLFDTILSNQVHDYFKNNVDTIQLSVHDIDKIINVRYEWEHKWRTKEGLTAENACSFHFIWWSRYSRYWDLTFVLLYSLKEKQHYWDNMLEFNRQLSKLFFIYSIRFQKLKSDIYYGFMHKVIHTIVNKTFKEVMTLVNEKIGLEQDHNRGWYDLNWFLTENLTENTKRKNLICRMSAMLDEDYRTSDVKEVENIRKRLFDTPIDIEHIQSYHDSNGEKREDVWQEWQENIHSIGNLMILEQTINRSIRNNPYGTKIARYPESVFSVVKNHCKSYPHWDLTHCIERKETEKRKILDYIFD
ncbi:MAG: hypothetical protein BGO88_08490 [Flavobacterium sp. 38-13]|uniref:DUF262 domain-containing protein n=1 Tax=Flavobacterium sp. 38-13 TaxID=1896168 RepID=UPI00095E83B2|nr:DUF262 domain-containing HNH endonuclease family protein [Flavobacterium sp. 38-13]OJX49784.1 MAG: hypothetical protein BGO88_08490 [Flavobacterium sp. 38-13]